MRHRKKVMNSDFKRIASIRELVVLISTLIGFVVVVWRLVDLQINRQDEFQRKLMQFTNQSITVETPRGEIKDRYGNSIVQNRKQIIITYQKSEEISEHKLKLLIQQFASDVLNQTNPQIASQIYDKITNAKDSIVVVLEDVDEATAARLGEKKHEFLGFDYEFELVRDNPEEILAGIIGSVSVNGLPKESAELLKALGYPLTSSTGKSGLEKEYESLLKGEFSLYEKSTEDKTLLIEKGEAGADLFLSIDLNLQKKLEEILVDALSSITEDPSRKTMKRILVAVSDPQTGDLLAGTSVVRNDQNEIWMDSSALYTLSYAPGSIIKGATLYAGLSEHAVSLNEVMLDEPLYIKGTPEKSSWKNLGYINDLEALAFSSNVYMMKTVIYLGGGSYHRNQSLQLNDDVFDLLRNIFSQFGLGGLTGADVYNEQLGYRGTAENTGNILDYAIGQYDTYTMMQLMQYINTIANGGKKLKPRLVLYAVNQCNEIIWKQDVTVLNQLSDSEALKRVQEGFELCVTHAQGLCKVLSSSTIKIAAKTGTAQTKVTYVFENGNKQSIDSVNNAVVAYAPSDDPKVSVACMIPNAWTGSVSKTNLCLDITKQIIESFLK